MPALKEKELIKRIQSGEKELLGTLVDSYYEDVFRFCYYKTGKEDAAYDCTQETFLKLIRFIGTYTEHNKFKAYLLGIARNTCIDYFRKETFVSGLSEFASDSVMEKGFLKVEQKDLIQSALDQLPDIQKDVIILRFYYDMKLTDIAKVIGTGVPTAKSRLKQGMNKLKNILGEEAIQ